LASIPSDPLQVQAPPNAPTLVILPGFGNDSGDYLAPFGNERASLAAALARRGFSALVVPVERRDWFKVARALLRVDFWRTRLTTDPGYSWYLQRVQAAVAQAEATQPGRGVVLVGHSAGGWLARAFVATPAGGEAPALSPLRACRTPLCARS